VAYAVINIVLFFGGWFAGKLFYYNNIDKAAIKPGSYQNSNNGETLSVFVSPEYSVIAVKGRDWYFERGTETFKYTVGDRLY
jgi:hypothetical protein